MKADTYFPNVWWNQWTWGLCFRPKLDHLIQAKSEAWVWLENQQWRANIVGGLPCRVPAALKCFSLICFLFSMRELAEGPILPISWQGFFLVPLWVEDMHLAQFPLANGKEDTAVCGSQPGDSCSQFLPEPSSYLPSSESLGLGSPHGSNVLPASALACTQLALNCMRPAGRVGELWKPT